MTQRSEPNDSRLEIDAEVLLRFRDLSCLEQQYSGNISLGGMYVRSDEPSSPGSIVAFELVLSDDSRVITGLGEVLWAHVQGPPTEPPSGMGIRFHTLNDLARELILRMMERHISEGGEPFEIRTPKPPATAARIDAVPESAASYDAMDGTREESDSGRGVVPTEAVADEIPPTLDRPTPFTPPVPSSGTASATGAGPLTAASPELVAADALELRREAESPTDLDGFGGEGRHQEPRQVSLVRAEIARLKAGDPAGLTSVDEPSGASASVASGQGDADPEPLLHGGVLEDLPATRLDEGEGQATTEPVGDLSQDDGETLQVDPLADAAGTDLSQLLAETGWPIEEEVGAVPPEPASLGFQQPPGHGRTQASEHRRSRWTVSAVSALALAALALFALRNGLPESFSHALGRVTGSEKGADSVDEAGSSEVADRTLTQIHALTTTVENGRTKISLEGNGPFNVSRYEHERIEAPPRVVIKVFGVQAAAELSREEAAAPHLERIRMGSHSSPTGGELRFVLDLADPEARVVAVEANEQTLVVILE